MMALTVPAAAAAVGKNWLPTLILVLASFLLCSWTSILEDPDWKWLHFLRSVTLVFLLSFGLDWTHQCWPDRGAAIVVPGILMLFAGYAVWKGSGIGACTVLRYGMYLILVVLGILGMSQVKLENLRPSAQLPSMELAAILLLPAVARKKGDWRYSPVGIAAVAASILTVGCATLYEYSRGLSMDGVTDHVESLAACGITVGYFAYIRYLLGAIKHESEKQWQMMAGGMAAYGIYLMGIKVRSEAYAALILVLWVMIPAFWTANQNLKKKEKSA